MTREDLIAKIQEKCDHESHGWWIFKWRSSFWLTKTEPYFTVQIPDQLPEEYTPFQVFKPTLVLTHEGVYIRGEVYSWSTILVTAILNDNARGLFLILGLNDGRLIEVLVTERKEVAAELGHMIEMYKRKVKKG